jgi:glycosyltransferase involved in cell wall biosynthesis
MKILFIGVGLTHYYNQVLNKLHAEPGLEIFDLVAVSGAGHAGESVHQTREGVKFNVVELRELTYKKFSDKRFNGFAGLPELLKKIKPDVIVASEIYIKMFLQDRKTIAAVKDLNIKIILKDIPFRRDVYEKEKEKIIKGECDGQYLPGFAYFFLFLCKKLRLRKLPPLIGKLPGFVKINSWYQKNIGRIKLLQNLEERKEILNFVDAHVDYADKAYEIFATYGVPAGKIFIIRNSPDTDWQAEIKKKIETEAPILPPCPHRILHVGRLIPTKRIDMLIESFSRLKREFTDAELLIIGYGPQESFLKDLAKKLNLEDSIKFIGGVYDPAVLGKYLLSSTMYVLAGMGGISINDAMIFGKPVICSVCDGTEKKLVRDGYNGLYFRDGDLDDLTAKIKYLFNHPELVKTMGENSLQIIRDEVNIHTVINGYKAAFNYVLKK